MASNKKSNKSMKASKKGKIIAILVTLVMAFSAIAYFVYFTGLIPKFVPGMRVVKVVDGKTSKIEDVSVLEFNYHLSTVQNSYQIPEEYMDTVYDETTGETYRDLLLKTAADEIVNCVLVENQAKAKGYDDFGGAERYAKSMADQATIYSTLYNMTDDQYLSSIYGRGMTTRLYRKCTERMAIATEYENYVKQFEMEVKPEEIEASFNENPSAYQRGNFSYKFFPVNEETKYDIAAAQADADKVVAALDKKDAPTNQDFADAVIAIVGKDAPELQGYTEDVVPYYYQSYSASLGYVSSDVTDYVFNQDNEVGSYSTIATDDGVYVIFVIDRIVDETPAVTYRSCTVYLSSYGGDYQKALDDANAFAAKTDVDSRAFDKYVKQTTVNPNEILTGGYKLGLTEEDFQGNAYQEATEIDTKSSAWLFDSARKAGDMTVITDAENNTVTVLYFEESLPMWQMGIKESAIALLSQKWNTELHANGETYEISKDVIKRWTY